MTGGFDIYLNGTLVASPKDWDGYDQEVVRDYKKRFIRVAYPGTFTMTNESGYPALRSLFVSDMCALVDFEAYETCGTGRYQIVKGQIVLADCEWNLNDCTVSVEVQDEAIGARLDNNVRIPVSPLAANSKNGEEIDPCTMLEIEVFDPDDDESTYIAEPRRMFDWLDAMQHCIRYITDSNIEVVSEWYDALPTNERIAICNGYQLRTGDTNDNAQRITYDFNTIWLEIAKRYNLWICVLRDNTGASYLAIEPEGNMFSDTSAIDLYYQYELVQSIDRDQLYSAVEVGDEDGIQNLDLQYSLPYLVLQGFSQEKFHFQGVCNEDGVLDLTGKWHADTNTIEKVLTIEPLSDEYDKDTFLIQYDDYLMRAVKGTYLSEDGPYLYNEQMLNVNILNRYTLPSDVGAYYDSTDTGFRASGFGPGGWGAITSPATIGCLSYVFGSGIVDNDVVTPPNNNPSGSWDIVLQRFTAPAQGYYELEVYMEYSVEHLDGTRQSGISVTFEHFDSSDTLLNTQALTIGSTFTQGTNIAQGSAGFVMNTGDYITRTFRRFVCTGNALGGSGQVIIQPLGHWTRTKFVAAGGGVLTSVDPGGARIVTYEFERLITTSDWNGLINDPRRGVGVSHTGGDLRPCHVMKATRDVVAGRTSFTLIAPKRSIS